MTNRGIEHSLDAWVRFYIALSDDRRFSYPEAWEPVNGHGNQTEDCWEAGTYFIGEVALPNIYAGEDFVVNIPWPRRFIPPSTYGEGRSDLYLLVEITPHDGRHRSGPFVENDNLAVKEIFIEETIRK